MCLSFQRGEIILKILHLKTCACINSLIFGALDVVFYEHDQVSVVGMKVAVLCVSLLSYFIGFSVLS